MTHYRLTGLFLREILVRLLWLAIIHFVVLLIASWIFPQLNLPYVDMVFSTIITDPLNAWESSFASDDAMKAGKFDKATVSIGIMGILSALLTFILSAKVTRQNQRKQSTLQILVESRSMQSIQALLVKAQKNSKLSRLEKIAILNYYEFLSVGVIQRNLDEAILEKTIRGFLCRGTYTWGDLIYDIRVKNGRYASYENLVAVYWRWLDKSRKDEWVKTMPNLGSRPWQWVSKTHKILHSGWQIPIMAGLISVFIVHGAIY